MPTPKLIHGYSPGTQVMSVDLSKQSLNRKKGTIVRSDTSSNERDKRVGIKFEDNKQAVSIKSVNFIAKNDIVVLTNLRNTDLNGSLARITNLPSSDNGYVTVELLNGSAHPFKVNLSEIAKVGPMSNLPKNSSDTSDTQPPEAYWSFGGFDGDMAPRKPFSLIDSLNLKNCSFGPRFLFPNISSSQELAALLKASFQENGESTLKFPGIKEEFYKLCTDAVYASRHTLFHGGSNTPTGCFSSKRRNFTQAYYQSALSPDQKDSVLNRLCVTRKSNGLSSDIWDQYLAAGAAGRELKAGECFTHDAQLISYLVENGEQVRFNIVSFTDKGRDHEFGIIETSIDGDYVAAALEGWKTSPVICDPSELVDYSGAMYLQTMDLGKLEGRGDPSAVYKYRAKDAKDAFKEEYSYLKEPGKEQTKKPTYSYSRPIADFRTNYSESARTLRGEVLQGPINLDDIKEPDERRRYRKGGDLSSGVQHTFPRKKAD